MHANKRPCTVERIDDEYLRVQFYDDRGRLAESRLHVENIDEWASNLEGMAQTRNGPKLCALLYRLVPQMALLP